jgi:hypothetical protein
LRHDIVNRACQKIAPRTETADHDDDNAKPDKRRKNALHRFLSEPLERKNYETGKRQNNSNADQDIVEGVRAGSEPRHQLQKIYG